MISFTDESIISGIIEFSDSDGRRYRCAGHDLYALRDHAWIHIGTTLGKLPLTQPIDIYRVIEQLDAD